MPLVLVHGVPETAAIWGPLRAELGRDDVVTLSPPGFGAPVPAGFDATADAYLQWLTGQLEALAGSGPIDLIGHDWGGLHVVRLVTVRPDLVRSWVSDVVGAFDPEYVWHDLAQLWQQPGTGEAVIETVSASDVAERTDQLVALGMTAAAARPCAEALGPQMGRCILALYRSAVQPRLVEWGNAIEAGTPPPGLAINPTADIYVGPDLAHRSAQRLGADEEVLDGLGHWWMLQDPARGAEVIRRFVADQKG